MANPINYTLDNGNVARIRLSEAKIALAGTPATGDPTESFFVAASGSSRRRTGIRARGVRYTTNVGTAAAPSIKSLFLPKVSQAALTAASSTVTYKGLTWTRSGERAEDN